MFKNPLKYQQGGAAPSQQEQQVLAAFIQWLPKRVKEFQGMQPEQIAQALDGMSKTPEGKKQLQQLMAQFQQEMQGGSQAFRQGGKIHDFICKHAKGGNLKGCGCKQEGGTFESKDKKVKIENFGTAQADTTGTYSYPSTNGEFRFNPMGRTATVWGNTGGWPIHRYADQNWINRHPRRQMLPGFLGGHRELAPDGFFENLVERVNNRTPQVQRCGGKVRKGQDGFLNLWQRAYDSKFGKGLRNFMFGTDSDLSNEEYVEKHGYSKPIMGMPPAVKISYIPEGVYGSTKMAEQAAKVAKEAAKFKHVSPLDGGRLGHTVKDVSGIHLKNNGGKV